MRRNRFTIGTSTVVVAALVLGLSACGSGGEGDSNEIGTPDPDVMTQVTGSTGATGSGTDKGGKQGDEMTPGSKAPASAGDKDADAPDDVISDRPGGPGTPSKP